MASAWQFMATLCLLLGVAGCTGEDLSACRHALADGRQRAAALDQQVQELTKERDALSRRVAELSQTADGLWSSISAKPDSDKSEELRVLLEQFERLYPSDGRAKAARQRRLWLDEHLHPSCDRPKRVTLPDLIAEPTTFDGLCVSVRARYYPASELLRATIALNSTSPDVALEGIDGLPLDTKKILITKAGAPVTFIGMFSAGGRDPNPGTLDVRQVAF